jgi:cobalamin biosynthesis protein CobT
MAAAPQEAAKEARRDPDLAPPISMFDKAANVDEFNLAHAAERLSARNVSHRIIVVLADGMTRGSVEALAETSASIERGGTMVLGVGIGDETVQAAYARNQVVERPETLAPAMVDGVRSALLRSIADEGGDTWWTHATEKITQNTN